MAAKIDVVGGSKIIWDPSFQPNTKKMVAKKLWLACEVVKSAAQKNVSIPTRSVGPSMPGEYPHADTGRLRNSIFSDVDETLLVGIVGTPLKYGLYLEFGTHGPRIIEAKEKALSWIGKDGTRRFAKRVVIPPLQPRSYLRRTMVEQTKTIQSIFSKAG